MINIFTQIKNKHKNRGKINTQKAQKAFAIFALFLLPFLMTPIPTFAVSMGDLNGFDKEINRLNNIIKGKKAEANTLQGQISIIDAEIQKIQLEINSTQAKISKLNSEIDATEKGIKQAEKDLDLARENLSEFIRVMYEEGQISTVEIMAKSESFNEFVNRSEYMEQVQYSVKQGADKVVQLKNELEAKSIQLEKNKAELGKKKADLTAQQSGVYVKRNEQGALLSKTKGQEAVYQKELASQKAARDRAWKEYQKALDRGGNGGNSNYSGGAGSGYLSKPTAGTHTQEYGWTSLANSGFYNGKIHNGIDWSCGWACSITAAAPGVVLDTGRTYNSQGWGNWIAVKHPNGLVTFYAHLSSILVSPGQSVDRGQLIGKEGNTGISVGRTGYHLHFSVYTNFVIYNYSNYHGPKYETTVDPFKYL